jgi:hypothetical protein
MFLPDDNGWSPPCPSLLSASQGNTETRRSAQEQKKPSPEWVTQGLRISLVL